MEVRSFHGETPSVPQSFYGTQEVIDPVYIRKESGRKPPRWDTMKNHAFFRDLFVFQIETPNITLKTKNSWPMGEKNQPKTTNHEAKGGIGRRHLRKEKGQPANHNHQSNLI